MKKTKDNKEHGGGYYTVYVSKQNKSAVEEYMKEKRAKLPIGCTISIPSLIRSLLAKEIKGFKL